MCLCTNRLPFIIKWKELISCNHWWGWIQGHKWWHEDIVWVSCINFFLLWLHFQTELFSMVAILTWPGPYWFLLTEQPYWNKMNIPFQKSSCRCLILHLTDKCGSYVCPRTDHHSNLGGYALELQARCGVRMSFIQRKSRLFFFTRK